MLAALVTLATDLALGAEALGDFITIGPLEAGAAWSADESVYTLLAIITAPAKSSLKSVPGRWTIA